MHVLTYNYCALAAAILNLNYSVDSAIDYFSPPTIKARHSVTADTANEMIRMKAEGMTYKDIGKLYGLKADAVYNRIRRAK